MCPFNTVQVKIREVSPEGIRVTMEERICERDEFDVTVFEPRLATACPQSANGEGVMGDMCRYGDNKINNAPQMHETTP